MRLLRQARDYERVGQPRQAVTHHLKDCDSLASVSCAPCSNVVITSHHLEAFGACATIGSLTASELGVYECRRIALRLAAAVEMLVVGASDNPFTFVPPVISLEARERIERYGKNAAASGKLVAEASVPLERVVCRTETVRRCACGLSRCLRGSVRPLTSHGSGVVI